MKCLQTNKHNWNPVNLPVVEIPVQSQQGWPMHKCKDSIQIYSKT